MKNYEITEEQIKELAKGNAKVKNWFPEVFKTKLEIGKWKKTPANGLYCPKEKTKDGFLCYGVCADSIWREINVPISITKDDIDATDSEVLEALTNEFKNKYPDRIVFDWYYNKEGNTLSAKLNNNIIIIFNNGIWTKFHTKEEAEKMLNAKII